MDNNTVNALIIKEKRGLFACLADKKLYSCRAATRFRNRGTAPVAGDKVKISLNPDGSGFITEICDRKNYFLRPHIANVDCFVIVITPAFPSPDLFVIDKLSCVAEKGNATPVFVVNKNDVGDGEALAKIYEKCGFKVFVTRADVGEGVEGLKEYLAGKTSVFCGASGVGKSSLLNILCPDADAQTGSISEKIGRGKNTTRHTELFELKNGGFVADTPGFSLLELGEAFDAEPGELANYFPEFEEYRYSCKYRNCTHTKDEGCTVLQASENGEIPESRVSSYRLLYEQLQINYRHGNKK